MNSTFPGKTAAQPVLPAFDLTPRLVQAVKEFEGFRPAAVLDNLVGPRSIWCIGYGETMGVQMGDTITQLEAEKRLDIRLRFFSRSVQAMVKVPLTQGQHDALTDFAYNLGSEALRNSTLLRVLNAGNYTLAASQFDRWIYAGGQKRWGLVARRAAEKLWFTEEAANA